MILENKHTDLFPPFLDRHGDYLLYNTFHQVKAFLLYPCGCDTLCQCETLREKIILTLNVHLYNQAQERKETPDNLRAMRFLLKIPDEDFFKKHYSEAYPVWLIQEQLGQEDRQKSFKVVAQLIEALLRLARTYELSLFKESRASITEALAMILGSAPLKTKAKKLGKEPRLCGEKAYSARLNAYKSVCHFIAALNFMEKNNSSFSLSTPDAKAEHVQQFLSVSHWFRKKLLLFYTPNIKHGALFSKKTLLSLPSWIASDDIDILIDPFEDKLQEINALFKKET
jgi:hypothetical protein